MRLKETLTSLVITGALVLGNNGCSDQKVIYEKPVQYDTFTDVDGDGKKDLIFAVKSNPSIFGVWYIFYKRNISEGQFGDPIFLYKSTNEPEGIPYETIGRKSERADYLVELTHKAEDFYKK